ncbi:PrsW family intramembrane metalloprotease [Vacuolonema iberomarrocanum]|uniref:PrsW family intramembrane metalloprotease n=1 Tax=Vacuolonema iberomarrocanum TaxID=3454632 RepID=UPI001A0A66CB|nr:PrsW family intramembrane metalloprotease [filamentous cyanobacterium LEGE 07170]
MTHSAITPVTRLMAGSPLRRRRSALIIISVLLGIFAFAFVQLVGLLTRFRPDAAWVFVMALAIAAVLSVVPISILWYLDRRERESVWAIATALLWGGVIATGLSAPINTYILTEIGGWVTQNPLVQDTLGPDAAFLIGAPIAGPLVEETIKGLGILALLIFFNAEFDNMRDGFIYGALVGIGFNWLESAHYVASSYAEFGIAPWGLQFGARFSLLGMAGHTLYSGLLGAFFGLALQTARGWVRLVAPVFGWLLAVLAHALNNSLGLLFALAASAQGIAPSEESLPPPQVGFLTVWIQKSLFDLILFLPFFVLILFLLWRSGIWERRVIREELLEEVGGAVTTEEYEAIRSDRPFKNRQIGRGQRRIARDLLWAQNELAFRKHRVRIAGENPETDMLVRGWREEAVRLRSMLPGGSFT